jgi:hypothetical protein
VHYLNSGDWVESMTAAVEHLDRTFEVITYEDWCRRANREPKGMMLNEPSADESLLDDPEPVPAGVSA